MVDKLTLRNIEHLRKFLCEECSRVKELFKTFPDGFSGLVLTEDEDLRYSNNPEIYLLEHYFRGHLLQKMINDFLEQYHLLIYSNINDDKINQKYKNYYLKTVEEIFNDKILSEFSFLSEYKGYLQNEIEKHVDVLTSPSLDCKNKKSIRNPLFANFPVPKIKRLYHLLTESAFIEADEEEFVNAFSGKEITTGIKWLVTGKNKDISKPSLFYFINQLAEKGFINNRDKDIKVLKQIVSLFRDKKNNHFDPQRLSTAISNYNPKAAISRKAKIDNIISQL